MSTDPGISCSPLTPSPLGPALEDSDSPTWAEVSNPLSPSLPPTKILKLRISKGWRASRRKMSGFCGDEDGAVDIVAAVSLLIALVYSTHTFKTRTNQTASKWRETKCERPFLEAAKDILQSPVFSTLVSSDFQGRVPGYTSAYLYCQSSIQEKTLGGGDGKEAKT